MGERVLKEHIEAERMRSPAPTAESVSQHRHRSQSPPKKKDKKQKKDKKKKKKRSRSEDPRGSQILSGTPPLRTQSEERAIDEELIVYTPQGSVLGQRLEVLQEILLL